MSKEDGFVPVTAILSGQALHPEEEVVQTKKSGSPWSKVAEVKPVGITQLQEEEKKNKEQQQQQQETRQQQQARTYKPTRDPSSYDSHNARDNYSNYHGGHGNYGGRSYDDHQPRERAPMPTSPPYTAFVGNLSYDLVDESELDGLFGEFGIKEIRIKKDIATGRSKGYAYIEFRDISGLEKALELSGSEHSGRKINVDVATTNSKSSSNRHNSNYGSGSYGGSHGGGYGGNSGGYGGNSGGYGGNHSGNSGGFGGNHSGNSGGFGGNHSGNSGGYGRRNNDYDSSSRYDSSGSSSWRQQGNPSSQGPASSQGPPRIELQPRTKPVEDIGQPVRRAGEDPFGGASSSDPDKLRRQVEERQRRERELENKRLAEKEARGKNSYPTYDPPKARWGPGKERGYNNERPQRNAEPPRGPTKQQIEKAEAVANPFAILDDETQ